MMRRRDFIRASAAVGTAAALAGCSSLLDGADARGSPGSPSSHDPPKPTPDDDRTRPVPGEPAVVRGITFDTVLDAVDDLGMDPTGRTAIDEALDAAHGDGVLIVFPPGDYLATDEHLYDTPTRRFGLLGLGESHRDVQFVFPEGNAGAPNPSNFRFLSFLAGSDVVIENLTFQMTDDMVTGVETVFTLEDGFWMVDVEFAGFMPKEEFAPANNVIAHITDVDGVGVIRRFTSTGGGVVDRYPQRGTPIGVFRGHRGELRIEDAHIEESGSHSIYASRPQGCVRVEGGLFRNNDNTNLRISGGGHPTKRSWIKGARIEIDVDNATKLPPGEHYQGIRGIWVEAGGSHSPGYSGLLIEDVDAVVRSNGQANELPLLLIDTTHGSVTVRNCRFRSFVENVEPIDARAPDPSIVTGPKEVIIEDTEIVTTATRVLDEGAALSITNRPGSRVSGTTIRLHDGWVDGISVEGCDQFAAHDSEITSTARGRSSVAGSVGGNAFGWNKGVVIRNSLDCDLRRLVIGVPGAPTEFEESQVRTEQISLSRRVDL